MESGDYASEVLEARTGVEPVNKGFADLSPDPITHTNSTPENETPDGCAVSVQFRMKNECPTRNADLLESANRIWFNQEMSTLAVAKNLLDLILEHCKESA